MSDNREIVEAAGFGDWEAATKEADNTGKNTAKDTSIPAPITTEKMLKLLDKIESLETELEQVKEENERLEKQWTYVPNEYENWGDFGQMLLDDNDRLTYKAVERGMERDECKAENAQLKAENEHLKALIEEILVENVGCTELRDLYRRKVRGGK